MKVLDLFCGMGGLTRGFEKAGFKVVSVDISQYVEKTFKLNNKSKFINADLSEELIEGDYDVIIGGPPCKPWSSVNLVKRGKDHPDYCLISRFFQHIKYHLPKIFIIENVPPLGKDETFKKHADELKKYNYSTMSKVVMYSDYGAPTRRRRLITFGIKKGDASAFFQKLSKNKCSPKTVKDAIWKLRNLKKRAIPDHDWPELRTIKKYYRYYKTGKFGWYILKWNEAAPSFGNVMKTYILHPDAFNGKPPRVISVKEALLIMGFDRKFRFPEDVGLGMKYQMIADAVSPSFSYIAAKVMKEMLNESV